MHISTIIIISICIIFAVSILRFFSSRIMFNPAKDHIDTPNRPHVDLMHGNIHIWHFNDYPGRPVILYCHGTSGNISYYSVIITLTARLGINLVLFDYHGYGKSLGDPSPSRLIEDAESAYEYTKSQYNPRSIVVLGESLGGAPAIHLASTVECRCLILLATFASLDILAKENDRYALNMLGYLLPAFNFNLPNAENIKNVTKPLLIMHSESDDFIPISHAYTLMKNYRGISKKLVVISGKHNRPLFGREHIQAILEHIGVATQHDYSDILRQIRLVNDAG